MNKKQKVYVGVSGGVDSSVALALLKEQGYDVTGVFLRVWQADFLPCDWKEERRSAMRVCATLGVPFITLDCQEEYKKEVVDYMIAEYSAGRVPNPDVFCNKFVKFGVFLKKALEMGADFIATGHYARKFSLAHSSASGLYPLSGGSDDTSASECAQENFFQLCESVDLNKDQSYFLYTLNQHQLSHTLFPVGHFTKPEVRKLAKKFGLSTAEKKDSQGLCFIGKVDMKDFLKHFIQSKEGDVLNTKGEVIGRHDGAIFYTIGQRHGFDVIKKSSESGASFVVSKDIEKNTITVEDRESERNTTYSTKEIILKNINFISGVEPGFPLKAQVRIRYRQEKQSCVVLKTGESYKIIFDAPQSGVAIGQSAVLYDGEICLGGGIIDVA